MKRTDYGYETNGYAVVRIMGTNIFSHRKSVDGFALYKKDFCRGLPCGERIDFSPYLSDIRRRLKEMGEL